MIACCATPPPPSNIYTYVYDLHNVGAFGLVCLVLILIYNTCPGRNLEYARIIMRSVCELHIKANLFTTLNLHYSMSCAYTVVDGAMMVFIIIRVYFRT